MTDQIPPGPIGSPPPPPGPAKKPWYKRWWAITLYVFIGLAILGNIIGEEEEPAASEPVETVEPEDSKSEEEPEPEPEKTKEPEPEKTKEPEPEKTKKPEPEKTTEKPSPTKSKEPDPKKATEKPSPTKSKEPDPKKATEKPSPTKSKEPEKTKEPEPTKTEKPKPKPTKTKTPEQQIEAATGAENVFVDSESAAYSGIVLIHFDIKDMPTKKMIASVAQTDSLSLLEAAHESDLEFDRVALQGHFDMTDQYGDLDDSIILNAGYDTETLDKIHFDNLQAADTVWDVKDNGMVHDELQD